MRNLRIITSKAKRAEIISAYLTGENSYDELARYYNVSPGSIRNWIYRYRKSKNIISLQAQSNPAEDMARRSKEGNAQDIENLEARIRELELQNLALNTLIDIAERNGIEIRKKSGAKQ